MPRGTGGKGGVAKQEEDAEEEKKSGAQGEWADLLLCSLVAPPSLDRLAPDDDALGLHSSAASVLSLSPSAGKNSIWLSN